MSSPPKRRPGPAELVERLHSTIDQLLAENNRLKRQLEKRAGVASGKVERGLKTIKRRVEKALTAKRPTKRAARRPTKAMAPRSAKRPPKSKAKKRKTR